MPLYFTLSLRFQRNRNRTRLARAVRRSTARNQAFDINRAAKTSRGPGGRGLTKIHHLVNPKTVLKLACCLRLPALPYRLYLVLLWQLCRFHKFTLNTAMILLPYWM